MRKLAEVRQSQMATKSQRDCFGEKFPFFTTTPYAMFLEFSRAIFKLAIINEIHLPVPLVTGVIVNSENKKEFCRHYCWLSGYSERLVRVMAYHRIAHSFKKV